MTVIVPLQIGVVFNQWKSTASYTLCSRPLINRGSL